MKFSQIPARAIVGMRMIPEPKTIALGGVAAGSIKVQLAAMADPLPIKKSFALLHPAFNCR